MAQSSRITHENDQKQIKDITKKSGKIIIDSLDKARSIRIETGKSCGKISSGAQRGA
jgi:hypothetical protein